MHGYDGGERWLLDLAGRRAKASASRQVAERALPRARSAYAYAVEDRQRARVVLASVHQRSIDTEVASTRRLVEDLADGDVPRYPRLDVLDPYFLAAIDRATLLRRVLDAALEYSGAEMGNVQLFDSPRRLLHIAAHRGFEHEFLDTFRWVGDDGTACAAALAGGRTVVASDVARSSLFSEESREVMLDARALAVQSVPLIGSDGRRWGVLSCHYHRAGEPTEHDSRLFEVLSRAAVRSMQWHARRNGDGAVDRMQVPRPR